MYLYIYHHDFVVMDGTLSVPNYPKAKTSRESGKTTQKAFFVKGSTEYSHVHKY